MKKLSKFLLILLLTTMLAFFLNLSKLSSLYVYNRNEFFWIFWQKQLAMFVKMYLWLGFGVFLFFLSKKFPLEKEKWVKTASVYFISSIFVPVIHYILFYNIAAVLIKMDLIRYRIYFESIFQNFRYNFAIFWTIVAFIYAVDYYLKNRTKKRENLELALENARLNAQLSKAQLETLKMQLRPHFLFNTLHAISGLMYEDVDTANKMIAQLSDLLRISLEKTKKDFVSLKEEIDFLSIYLEIHKILYKDRLEIKYEIDPETHNAKVPLMILQPLVENALIHGIHPHKRCGLIKIGSQLEAHSIILEVADNGDGFKPGSKSGRGIGLSNIKEQLEKIYSKDYSFEISTSAEGGCLAVVKIPYEIFDHKDRINTVKS